MGYVVILCYVMFMILFYFIAEHTDFTNMLDTFCCFMVTQYTVARKSM